jgi:hypothetical protein
MTKKTEKDVPEDYRTRQAILLGSLPDISSLSSHLADLPAIEPEGPVGTPRQGASLNEVIGVMLGSAEIYSLKNATTQVQSYWKKMKGEIRGKRFMRGGFALGFYLGYDDDPDCGGFGQQLNESDLYAAASRKRWRPGILN